MNIGPFEIGRRRAQDMQQQAQDYQKDAKDFGHRVKVGFETASRHMEKVGIMNYWMDPTVHIYDKVNSANVTIALAEMWGMGQPDWDGRHDGWVELYSEFWHPLLSAVESSNPLPKVIIEMEKLEFPLEDNGGKGKEKVEVWAPIKGDFQPETVVFFQMHKDMYRDIKIIDWDFQTKNNPGSGMDISYLRPTLSWIGTTYMLQYCLKALNHVYVPEHVNDQSVLVLSGGMPTAPQFNVKPTGGNPDKPSGPRTPGIQET